MSGTKLTEAEKATVIISTVPSQSVTNGSYALGKRFSRSQKLHEACFLQSEKDPYIPKLYQFF